MIMTLAKINKTLREDDC